MAPGPPRTLHRSADAAQRGFVHARLSPKQFAATDKSPSMIPFLWKRCPPDGFPVAWIVGSAVLRSWNRSRMFPCERTGPLLPGFPASLARGRSSVAFLPFRRPAEHAHNPPGWVIIPTRSCSVPRSVRWARFSQPGRSGVRLFTLARPSLRSLRTPAAPNGHITALCRWKRRQLSV